MGAPLLSRIISVALVLFLTVSPNPAARETTGGRLAEGTSLRLTADSIELVLADGSVLSAARDSLDGDILEIPADSPLDKKRLEDAFARLSASLDSRTGLPKAFSLAQNSPNPFNPATTISYAIATDAGKVGVILEVFDIRGRLVRTLVNEEHQPGQYSYFWQGTDDFGRQLGSGIYFYRMRAGKWVATRKMVILK
ncbi:MAG: FlgD immunoglobulin-like domain containing protein [Candidatus Glassbacteria bacterium]